MQSHTANTSFQQFKFPGQHVVTDVAPVEGWSLWTFPEPDSDGFEKLGYFARRGSIDFRLDVSRSRFSPTQERFAFFVANGFPARMNMLGPWDDTEIDYCIEHGMQPRAAEGSFPYADHRSLAAVDGDAA